jgi:hypothetical protein
LVSSSETITSNRHGRLTGSEHTSGGLWRILALPDFSSNSRKESSDILGFSFNFGTQDQRIEAKLSSPRSSRIHEQTIIPNDVITDAIE